VSERTDFLYPFIEGDEHDAGSLVDDLAASAQAKSTESRNARVDALEHNAQAIDQAARAMADRFIGGGRLFTFGDGGSSTDASLLAAMFAAPVCGRVLPARSLVEDTAILTALGNDVGFDLVFSRQLIAHGAAGDMAFGCSTSGNSRNVLHGLGEARAHGMLTVGLSGYDGGEMMHAVDHCLVVGSDSVHRIQETQAALGVALWDRVQSMLTAGAPNG
jgi:D-sedoheptulose 7-phosphate isomerase